MSRSPLRSLRVRMAVLSATAAVMTLAAALALIWGLRVAGDNVERLASAQARLELLSALSARVGDYALVALRGLDVRTEDVGELSRARDRARQAFHRIDAAIGEGVESLSGETERALMAARGRLVANMRARFDVLDGQVTRAVEAARVGQPRDPDAVKASLNGFAAGFGPLLTQALAAERAAALEAQESMRRLKDWLINGAVFAAALAVAVAVAIYASLARPVARRISAVVSGAGAIARGRFHTRLVVTGRDELSLLMARFNRMAAQLARREARLIADQEKLQDTIDARTAELQEANRTLTEVDRSRRRFFADVSHELRTPLTVILGETEVSLRRPASLEDLRAALRVIQARARRLHRRVEDLLRVARSESGQIELDLAPVDVAGVVADACDGVEALARTAGVELAIEAGEPDQFAEADREWLRQTLEGLLSNAVRHSRAGGTVRVACRRRATTLEITVADDGEGIPREELPHVFERFYRGSGPAPAGGFGIGLALARWIMERHGGSIALDSRTAAEGEGRAGTVVTMTLPALTRQARAGAAS